MNWPEVALGQVEAIHPSEFAVSVVFPNLGMLTGIRVPVAPAGASREAGRFELPQRGDWGVVLFMQNDVRSARWVHTLADSAWHAAPLELLTADPDLRAAFERTGRDSYRHGNGDVEVQHPDGSLFRVTHAGGHADRTDRQVGITEGAARTRKRIKPTRKTAKRMHVYFEQKDRLTAHLDDEGNLRVTMIVPDEPPRKLRYKVEALKDGTVRVENRPESKLEMLPSGEVKVSLKNGAQLQFTEAGDVIVQPAPGKNIKLGAGPAYFPVLLDGDLSPSGPVKATGITVLASR
ncbi:hypothetical protein [Deinococcus sp. UR1]|uniref:hypothetical protein n=1 Tax=Deinococcus sp. UR1 TaxID=1704277 RepID=UPI000C1935B9|nr:hypothetical protein [Deinococcus sp. UR1]PIG96871.1 hypothetical protein AMD26_015190 [Deinococcus sp. UR1]